MKRERAFRGFSEANIDRYCFALERKTEKGASPNSSTAVGKSSHYGGHIITTGTENPVKQGDMVSIAANACWYNNKEIPNWIKGELWTVRNVEGIRAVIGKSADGKYEIEKPISTRYLEKKTEEEWRSRGKTEGKKVTDSFPYFVKPGDTIRKIADSIFGEGEKWREILQKNGKDSENVFVGELLLIPKK